MNKVFSPTTEALIVKNQCIKEDYGQHKTLFAPVMYFIISALCCTGGL